MCAKIIQITKAKAEQSKPQKDFNRLVKKIEKLEKDLQDYREVLTLIQQRTATEMAPAQQQYFEQRAKLAIRLDRAHDSTFFKKSEKKKLAHLIQEIAFEVVDEGKMEEFKALYDKYSDEGSYDELNEEATQDAAERMKMMFAMFGMDLGEDFDLKNPEKMQAKLMEMMEEKQATLAEEERRAEERRAKRPKTQKQLEREEKKNIETNNITKAVRTIYMDLVKAFHPDREKDETERDRKTEIMQRVTQAYEKSDILALLRLQLEFDRISQSHIESLATDQLKYYNQLLREQTRELEDAYEGLQMQAQMMGGSRGYMVSSPFSLQLAFEQKINEYKQIAKNIKKDLKDFQNDEILRAFLKQYKIPKQNY